MVPYWSNCHVSGVLQKTQEIMFLTFIIGLFLACLQKQMISLNFNEPKGKI